MDNVRGLIGISTSKSFISRCIQFFRKDFIAKDPPTHIFVVFGKLLDEIIVGESTNPKIRLAPLSKHLTLNKKIELWEIEGIPYEKKKEAVLKLMPLTGKTYGFWQFLGFIWVWVAYKLGFSASNPIDGDSQIVCSEYGFMYLRMIGHRDKFLMSINQNDVAPDHFLTSFIKNPACKLRAVSDFGTKELKEIK